MSSLTARLRDILGTDPPRTADVRAAAGNGAEARGRAARLLGGEVHEGADGAWIAVDRRYANDGAHGTESIGKCAELVRRTLGHLPVLAGTPAGDADLPSATVFFDLETTGLAGGAGTYAFLVGFGAFGEDGFETRQFLLTGYRDEPALLRAVATWLARARLLVSFNGRTFDAPLLETRYLFHRAAVPFLGLPHLDMLHPARRLWRRDEGSSLQVLEQALAGLRREGDVPGAEIPARYLQFVRTGDARPLLAVFEHNRLDLLTLAVITARATDLVERGPAAAGDPCECLGLGRLYERAARHEEATVCYARAGAAEGRAWAGVRADALRRLARRLKRAGRHREAAEAWQRLLAPGASSEPLAREAARALAVYHEHRSRDLHAARRYALRAVEAAASDRHRAAARHRLLRLSRKLGGSYDDGEGALFPD